MRILNSYYDRAMKIHELLTPEDIELDFAPSPGQELKSKIRRLAGLSRIN